MLTHHFRTTNTENFFESLRSNSKKLYMVFGRDFPWDDDSSPPPSLPSDLSLNDFRDNILGLKRIPFTNLCFVAARKDWVFGNVYVPYSADDPDIYTKDFYVMTLNYNVYKCLDNAGGQPSTSMPSGTSVSPVTTADGYTWKFMYNISSPLVSTFLLLEWMPVPTGDQKTSLQIAVENSAVPELNAPPGGHGKNALEELGGFNIVVYQSFGDETIFSSVESYRQIGLWENPTDSSGVVLENPTYSLIQDSNYSDIDKNSGKILFFDNREPIEKDPDQPETIQLIFGF